MEKINLAYKFKLNPSESQIEIFSSWAGTCRFLYNLCLEHRILSWTQYRSSINYYDQANELKDLKSCEGFEWIKDSPAQILQQSLKDLDKAFKSFWRSGFGFPKYKKKGIGDSFRFPDAKQFSVRKVTRKKAFVKLPKIGEVAFRLSRKIEGKIKNATIKKEVDGWYIAFCSEKHLEIPYNNLPTVGIDRGISETLVLSSRDDCLRNLKFTLPKNCHILRERIKVLQKRLRLKKKFSQSWKKVNNKIRKLHSKIASIRHDFLHKASSYIAKNHSYVTLEDLKIKNMSKSAKGTLETPGKNVAAKSGLNREILFQGWGIFALQLSYKCEWNGGHLELVNPKFTSTRCSECLYNNKMNRKNKHFECLNCGHKEDADLNAAKNINRVGRTQRDCGGVGIGQTVEAVTPTVH
ncbi:MAG: transposase [Halobacteriovoraceae bacterium]|nr:transposase [Halobacteriovoraceae bacterium]MCB9063275.1 transposase [Halobacteriovoraceae bacterium]MCB9063281.1 transposase [Halobacteriovoraceae bacterium]MCB9063493.1 transposase [Halobacteriovoraceae bacterium]